MFFKVCLVVGKIGLYIIMRIYYIYIKKKINKNIYLSIFDGFINVLCMFLC